MGGGGFAIDMIRKVKANRALRKEKINRYKANAHRLSTKRKHDHKYVGRTFKAYTDAERKTLRKELRAEKIRAAIIGWTASVFIIVLVALVVYLIFL